MDIAAFCLPLLYLTLSAKIYLQIHKLKERKDVASLQLSGRKTSAWKQWSHLLTPPPITGLSIPWPTSTCFNRIFNHMEKCS